MILETFPVGMLGCNCSILGDESTGQALVIDPGDDADKVVATLARHELSATHILHTHAHIDHIGGSAEVKRSCGCRAHLHSGDQWLYENLAMQGKMLGLAAVDAVELDEPLQEGDTFSVGALGVEVLHTPGHSPGSVSFVLEAENRQVVFAGDTLFRGGIGRTDLWGGDTGTIMKSLHGKLMALDDDAEVITGHGPPTTIGRERRSNPFLSGGASL
ncbi:MAG: hypothetical protein DHS20C15_10410 [Planctomycetota bacterium]|nr:MAG: hypothetical protein DHS20C15_10410 [Planctomycetota bacterium]